MSILRAIGGFFVRIGRWIKNTAWVQPLLIVGGIFAIIFSIPYISNWVSSWFEGDSAGLKYYNAHKVSLEGAQNDGNNKSDANALFTYMRNDLRTPEDAKRWGEKFFVIFAQDDCKACEDIYKGFSTLESEWGTGEFALPEGESDLKPFKLYSVFIDTEADVNDETKNLFKEYFFNEYDSDFEEISASMQESAYARNEGGSSYTKDLESVFDVDGFKSPTIFLFDPSYREGVANQLAVNEVLFAVGGKDDKSGAYPMARTLYDCWYHLDVFSNSYEAK